MNCDYCRPVSCFCGSSKRPDEIVEAVQQSVVRQPDTCSIPLTATQCRMNVFKFLGIQQSVSEASGYVSRSQAGHDIMRQIGATPRTTSLPGRGGNKARNLVGGTNIGSVPVLSSGGHNGASPFSERRQRQAIPHGQSMGQDSPAIGPVNLFAPNGYPPGVDEESPQMTPQDRVLYTECEVSRRLQCPAYAAACREQTFDLTISMPLQLPYSAVVVDVLSGEHYFGKRREFADLVGAPHSDHSLFGRGIPVRNTLSSRTNVRTDIAELNNVKDYTTNKYDSACDMWAAFLRVKLGTVYNVREHQLKLVAETLRSSLSKSIFENPITFNASGIYCLDQDGVEVSCPPRFNELRRDQSRGYHYVTHLKPSTLEDFKSMVMIRQRIKGFANRLVKHFGFARGPGVNCTTGGLTPIMHVELDPNFSTMRLNEGTVRVLIREYSPVLPAWIADLVWSFQGGRGVYTNTSATTIKSKVETTEIRLEHLKGRMIDPRWPKELVIGRRIGGYNVGEPILNLRNLTRFVFSRRMSAMSFLYRAGFLEYMQDQDFPSDCSAKKEAIQACLLKTKFQREVANHLKYEPSAGMSARISHEDLSPTKAPIPVLHKRNAPAKNATLNSTVPATAHDRNNDIKLNVHAQPFSPTSADN